MSDLASKLQDRVWVADMIRRTEEAQAANRRLLEVLYQQQREQEPPVHEYDVRAEAVIVGDVVWWQYAWRTLASRYEASPTSDCVSLAFEDGTEFSIWRTSTLTVRRPRLAVA